MFQLLKIKNRNVKFNLISWYKCKSKANKDIVKLPALLHGEMGVCCGNVEGQ